MAADSDTLLEIAIPTYNGSGTIEAAIESLFHSIGATGVKITVYDNASTDLTIEVIRRLQARHPALRLRPGSENVGFDGNVRRCIEGAVADYVWFFSDDDVCPPDAVARLRAELARTGPSVAYLNHHVLADEANPFSGAPLNVTGDRVFDDPRAYLQVCGLGFISALVLRTRSAKAYASRIKLGQGQAHLDVAVRMVLSEPGPYVLLGDLSIAARPALRYDGLKGAYINVALFYRDLRDEGLVTDEEFTTRVRHIVGRDFLGNVIRQSATNRAGVRAMLDEFAPVGRLGGAHWRISFAANRMPACVWRAAKMLKSLFRRKEEGRA